MDTQSTKKNSEEYKIPNTEKTQIEQNKPVSLDKEIKDWRLKQQQPLLTDFLLQSFEFPRLGTETKMSGKWNQSTSQKTFECNRQYYFFKLSPEKIVYGKLGSKEVKTIEANSFASKKNSIEIEIVDFTLSENLDCNILMLYLNTNELIIYSINNAENLLQKIPMKLTLKVSPKQFVWKNNAVFFSAQDELQFLMFDQNIFKPEVQMSAEDLRRCIKYDKKLSIGSKIDLFDISRVYNLFSIVSDNHVYIFDTLGVLLFSFEPNLAADEKITEIKNFRRKLEEPAFLSANPENLFKIWDLVLLLTSKNRIFVHDISLMTKQENKESKSRIAILDFENLLFLPKGKASINLLEVSEENNRILFVSQNFRVLISMEINRNYQTPDPNSAENKLIIPFVDRTEVLLMPETTVFSSVRLNVHKNQFISGIKTNRIGDVSDCNKQFMILFMLGEDFHVGEYMIHVSNFGKKNQEKRSVKKRSTEIFFDKFVDKKQEIEKDEMLDVIELEGGIKIIKRKGERENRKSEESFGIKGKSDQIVTKLQKINVNQFIERGLMGNLGEMKVLTGKVVLSNLNGKVTPKTSLAETVGKTVTGMFYLDSIEENNDKKTSQKSLTEKQEVENKINLKETELELKKLFEFKKNDLEILNGKLESKKEENNLIKIVGIDNRPEINATEMDNQNIVKLNLLNCDKKLVTKAVVQKKETEKINKPNNETIEAGKKEENQEKKEASKTEKEPKKKTEEINEEFPESFVKTVSYFHQKLQSKIKKEVNEGKKLMGTEIQSNLQSTFKSIIKTTNEQSSKMVEKTLILFMQKLIKKNFEGLTETVDSNHKYFKEKIEAHNLTRKYALESISIGLKSQKEGFEEVSKVVKESVERIKEVRKGDQEIENGESLEGIFEILGELEKNQKKMNEEMFLLNEKLDKLGNGNEAKRSKEADHNESGIRMQQSPQQQVYFGQQPPIQPGFWGVPGMGGYQEVNSPVWTGGPPLQFGPVDYHAPQYISPPLNSPVNSFRRTDGYGNVIPVGYSVFPSVPKGYMMPGNGYGGMFMKNNGDKVD